MRAFSLYLQKCAVKTWSFCITYIKSYFSKKFLIDTLCNMALGFVSGIVKEKYIIGKSWDACMDLRIKALLLDFLFARMYTSFRDYMFKRLGIKSEKLAPFSREFFKKFFWDTLLFVFFWTALYAFNLSLSGSDIQSTTEFKRLLFWFIVVAAASGGCYGIVLDIVRRKFDQMLKYLRRLSLSKKRKTPIS